MTQLYVGNLSAEGDEKAIRVLFGKYGIVREVLMKNGYAFVEYESAYSAEEAIRALNGSDILGHPMIVEPSHQQRLSTRRKAQFGRVEVTSIPPQMSLPNIETMLTQVGQVLKMEIEESEFGVKRIIVTYETQEQAQRAAAIFKGDEHSPKITYLEMSNGMRTTRKGSPGVPSSPSKNSDFPLRILVPSDMVGAIIGKDGATIRMITQITKARVDVHRRENLGSAEKAITIIGPPECCTEACYQIMKIMQNELLMTSGMLENGKFHEPLPVVPLKVLAHNELVGRVIGKGGNTLKRIMAESGTKITISKLKDLTAYNMERTITILGTIDNCKKAESLISAKLRASYESDMAQFIPEQTNVYTHPSLSPSPTNVPPTPTPMTAGELRLQHAQSLPTTPTNVRTFTDFSGEHTRLTTLHGSTGALEVNNLGGFKLGPHANGVNGINGVNGTNGTVGGGISLKYPPNFEATIDGFVKTNGVVNGVNGAPHGQELPTFVAPSRSPVPPTPVTAPPTTSIPTDFDDEISDVFSGLSMKDPLTATPGYGRMRPRRSSAPVSNGVVNGHVGYWGGEVQDTMNGSGDMGGVLSATSRGFSSGTTLAPSYNVGWNSGPVNSQPYTHGTQNIWSNAFQASAGGSSRPNSQTSSYSNSEQSSLSGFSPIYSPTTTSSAFFSPEVTSCAGLLTTNPTVAITEEQHLPFKASVPTPLTTVAETPFTMTDGQRDSAMIEEDDLFGNVTSAALELIGDIPHPLPVSNAPLVSGGIRW